MALNGSVSVDATPNGRDRLIFSWSAVQDPEARTSTVSWQLQLVADQYGQITGTDIAGSPWSVTVDGEEVTGTSSVVIAANQTKTLASGQKVLTHAEDGTRTFAFSFSQYFGITWVETEIGYVTGSGTGELDAFTGSDPEQPDQPETPEKFPIHDFLNGLVMALCGRPIRWPSREPVAYLYNGVRLPDIYTVYTPEVQKTHPFALMQIRAYIDTEEIDRVQLRVFAENAYYWADSNGVHFGASEDGELVSAKTYTLSDGVWEFTSESSEASFRLYSVSTGTRTEYPHWANFDAEYEGTLYLAASEPVPVYE